MSLGTKNKDHDFEPDWQDEKDWFCTVEFVPTDDPEARLFAADIIGGPGRLSDSQDEDLAGPPPRAPQRARGPARSVPRHFCLPRSGNHGGRGQDLQMRPACDRGAL